MIKKNIKIKYLCIILFFVFISSIPIAIGYNVKFIQQNEIFNKSGNILNVGGTGPDNYTFIQDAVNDSVDGDIIFVYNHSSPYKEYIRIEKSINLIGEDKFDTIIEGGWEHLVYVRGSNVTITGFTIRDCGWYYSGGISLSSHSNNNNIFGNIFTENINHGIDVASDYNNIFDNIFYKNRNGIYIIEGKNNLITNNLFESNNGSGIIQICGFDGPYKGNENNTIEENIFINNRPGIKIVEGHNTIIKNNIIRDNSKGIEHFIFFPFSFINDTIVENNKIINNKYGLFFYCSNRTIVRNNTIVSNNYSIYVEDCNDNLIYHNNFAGNKKKRATEWMEFCNICCNKWDNDYPSCGNYWDAYNGSDNFMGPNQDIPGSDGIGDTIYNCSGNTEGNDGYPLMKPWKNDPPEKPEINGPLIGNIGVNYFYNFTSFDLDSDDLFYFIDWGDKINTGWLGPFESGETIEVKHYWKFFGIYVIKAKVRDIIGSESQYSEFEIKISIPRYMLWDNLFDNYPLIKRILIRFFLLD